MKLCLFKVAKSDACIRPLFANPVTYNDSLALNISVVAMPRHCIAAGGDGIVGEG